MKCNNPITIAHYTYKGGKSVIEGSQSVMKKRIKKYGLDKSINGYYEHKNCEGDVEVTFFIRYDEDIVAEFRCNSCGIMHELPYELKDLEDMINKSI